MIEIKLGDHFIAVPIGAVCRNGIYLQQLNTYESPYNGNWHLVSTVNRQAVDNEHNLPFLYRSLEEARQDAAKLEELGEHSTCCGVVNLKTVDPEEFSIDEVVERIGKALAEMDGQDLAYFYNQHFGSGMQYCGDGVFRQVTVQEAES